MRSGMLVLLLMSVFVVCSAQKDLNAFENRTAMIQMFEWRFEDIEKECTLVLGPKGFAGVQVSPVTDNLIITDRPWYERYQVMSYLINTRLGNEEDLYKMVKACNGAGVRVYVDVVFNHMTGDREGAHGTAGSSANTSQRSYPAVPYDRSHFHTCTEGINYNSVDSIRNCELVGLHDLNQGMDYVRNKIIGFLNRLISMGVAGFRIDAAKHMWPADLEYIFSKLDDLSVSKGFPVNRRPYISQEVIDFGTDGSKATDYTNIGMVQEFKFVKLMRGGMQNGDSFRKILALGNKDKKAEDNYLRTFLPNEDAVIFVDNHDTQREDGSICHNTPFLCKMATVIMLALQYGKPIILSSYEFSDFQAGPPHDEHFNILPPGDPSGPCRNGWICEHRWPLIMKMVNFRNHVKDAPLVNLYFWNDKQAVFEREKKGLVAINMGSDNLAQTIKTTMPKGVYCDIVTGDLDSSNNRCTGKSVEIDSNGFGRLNLSPFQESSDYETQKKSESIEGLTVITSGSMITSQ